MSVKQCTKCQADLVVLTTAVTLKRPRGGHMAVNREVTKDTFRGPNEEETVYIHGVHQPHFLTCPKATHLHRGEA